jgi:hypothetical protein
LCNIIIPLFVKRESVETPQSQIHIRHIYRPLQTRITILAVDSAFSMAMEMKDDDNDTKGPLYYELPL